MGNGGGVLPFLLLHAPGGAKLNDRKGGSGGHRFPGVPLRRWRRSTPGWWRTAPSGRHRRAGGELPQGGGELPLRGNIVITDPFGAPFNLSIRIHHRTICRIPLISAYTLLEKWSSCDVVLD